MISDLEKISDGAWHLNHGYAKKLLWTPMNIVLETGYFELFKVTHLGYFELFKVIYFSEWHDNMGKTTIL